MIAIVMLTHADPPERIVYAMTTLVALRRLTTSEPLHFHLADDGSGAGFREEIMEHAREHYGDNVSVSNSEGRGYGASYNLATQSVHQIADLIVPIEDDWELQRPFNLDVFAAALRARSDFKCIRMGYIGYTDILRATFFYEAGAHYLLLDPDSPEKHVFAGGPRIETREFERELGEWPEITTAGGTELEVAGRPESRQGVLWPIDSISPSGNLFAHIGTIQSRTGEAGSRQEVKV